MCYSGLKNQGKNIETNVQIYKLFQIIPNQF